MPRKLAYALLVLVVLSLIATAFAGGFLYGHTVGKGTAIPIIGAPKGLAVVEEARDIIKQQYVNKVSDAKLTNGSVSGMVKSLGDPYSEYVPPEEMTKFKAHMLGEFSGVGVTLGMRKGKVTVVRPLPRTPAMRAGIRAGDVIATIDGTPTAKMSLPAASEKIRGPKGTKVRLGIKRGASPKLRVFSLTRATISVPTIDSSVVGPGIGYVSMRGFTPTTGADFEKAVMDLDRKKHVKGVIVDLRDNPGGLVESAVEAASVFIRQGPVVSIKGRDGRPETLNALENEYHTKMKLVVLVNGNSASASEIFAGAMQDDKRGLIVGTKTFGKASVQTIEDLINKGALKITTAHYYTPKGRLIQKSGIKPDIIDKGPADPMTFGTSKDTQRNRAIEILRKLVDGRIKQ